MASERREEPIPVSNQKEDSQILMREGQKEEQHLQKEVSKLQDRLPLDILEGISDAFFVLNRNWFFTYVSESASLILQRAPEELLGQLVWEQFPEAVDTPFYHEYHRAMKKQVSVLFQAYFEPLDLWAEVRANPFEDGLIVHFIDITERKRLLDVNEQHYRSLFDQNPDAIYSFDLHGNYLSMNHRLEEIFGYSTDELLHHSFEILCTEHDRKKTMEHFQKAASGVPQTYEVQTKHKEGHLIDVNVTNVPILVDGKIVGVYGICKDITAQKQTERELVLTKERLEAFLMNSADAIWMMDLEDRLVEVNPGFESLFGYGREVIGGKLPIIPDFLADEMERVHQRVKAGESMIGYETQRLCKNGQLMYVSATLSPVRDSKGTVIGISGTCRDISKFKQSTEELRATKELFESIFNYTTDAVLVIDLSGNILALNTATEKMSGWSQQKAIGKRFPLDADSTPQHIREKYFDVLHGRIPYAVFEYSPNTENGKHYDLQVTMSPISDQQGQVSAILLIAKDVTESKKAQELLIQTEKLSIAGQLAAGVAHEIRNPLTALKGFVQLMGMGEVDSKKYIDVMASELNRIEMIVSELLVLAKPQAMTFKRKQIVPILEDVLTLSGTQAILHNVQILTDFPEDLPELDCDENQLKQVFINFIKNAIEAMPKGGHLRIDVQLQTEHHRVRICFADEGNGIPKERLARLGEPFYTTKTKGTGLGLMVSKKIIENHRGQLVIESEVGIGTQVIVYLPL